MKGLGHNSGLVGNLPVEQAIDLLAQEGYQAIDFTSLFRAVAESPSTGYISVEYEAAAWGYPSEPRQVLFESKRFLEGFLSPSS